MPTSAVCCTLCPASAPSEIKELWTSYQLACVSILSARCNHPQNEGDEHRTEARMQAPAQVGSCSSSIPPLPLARAGGKKHDFRMPLELRCNQLRWPYHRGQFHKLAHFASQLLQPPQDASETPLIPTLLELYGAYLCANGGARFHSGVSCKQNGHWLSSQLETFTNAWKAFEALTGFEPLVPARAKDMRTTKWGTALGLPPLPLLLRPVILPRWCEVRRWIETYSQALAEMQAQPHEEQARLWRRWIVGAPNTQTMLSGDLSVVTLLMKPSTRTRVKCTPTSWETQCWTLKRFITQLCTQPLALARWPDAQCTVATYLQYEGVINFEALTALAKWHRMIANRAALLLRHEQSAVGHSIDDPYTHRPVCTQCQASGYTTFAPSWLRSKCHLRDGVSDRTLRHLMHQHGIAKARALALSQLARKH